MGNRRDVIFLCLAVVMLVAAVFFVRSRSLPGAPTSVAKPTPKPVATAVAKAEAPTAAKPAASSPTGTARNPFAPPMREPHAKPTAVAPGAAPATTPAGTTAPVATQTPAPSALPPLTPQATPAATAPAAPSGPALAGIIDGATSHPRAVIRTGNRRYFARQGDKLAGGYTVQSISSQRVVLTSAQGKLTLKMGGS